MKNWFYFNNFNTICFYISCNNFFKKKLTKPKQFKIPIICVGNIYVGGTGKTPTSILLANEISKSEKKLLF